MVSQIRVAILDDHQSIIDGYTYRLCMDPEIQIVSTALYGEDLEPMLADNQLDVLLLDLSVPNSPVDHNPFPILHVIPQLLQKYPHLSILAISMFTQPVLIETLVNAGISGYIFKDDQASIQKLDKIVRMLHNGERYFSEGAYEYSSRERPEAILTVRQLEALSVCISHPDSDTVALARELSITSSTLRNLLSSAYFRLGVRTRAAAIAKAHQLGIIPDNPEFNETGGKAKPRPAGKRVRRASKIEQ
ncbi:MAG: response regulator transcription factor [Anaerolineales bacterium]